MIILLRRVRIFIKTVIVIESTQFERCPVTERIPVRISQGTRYQTAAF